jgi:hypothetical protein
MNPEVVPNDSCSGRGVSEKLLDSWHRSCQMSQPPITDASIIEEYIDMNSPRQGYTA